MVALDIHKQCAYGKNKNRSDNSLLRGQEREPMAAYTLIVLRTATAAGLEVLFLFFTIHSYHGVSAVRVVASSETNFAHGRA